MLFIAIELTLYKLLVCAVIIVEMKKRGKKDNL